MMSNRKSQQQQHSDNKRSNTNNKSKKRTIAKMVMEGDDLDEARETAAAAGAEESSWEIFQAKHSSMEDHIDFIKKKYRELMNELKLKGKTMTSQILSAYLALEFFKVDNDEVSDQFLHHPQIAEDALEILKTEVDEIVEAKFKDQIVMVNEFKSHVMVKSSGPNRQRCSYCALTGRHSRTRFMCQGCGVPFCSIGSGKSSKDCFTLAHDSEETLGICVEKYASQRRHTTTAKRCPKKRRVE